MTKVLKINPNRPEKKKIDEAAAVIRGGGVAVFPTETVYGIGADPFNKKPVRKIFKLKGRSFNKPLSIIVLDAAQLKTLIKRLTPIAKRLIKRYMPGPLTLIMPKSKLVPDAVTSGEATIGIRMPDHKITRALIRACGGPIIATSANRSGKAPATTARAALGQLKDIDILIDGGPSKLKEASTVVDLSRGKPKILRRGTLRIDL